MALQAAFEHMDQQLIELLQANGTLVGSQSSGATDSTGSSSFRRSAADDPGSTAVLAMLLHQQRMLVVGNVGNSRALLCSSKVKRAGFELLLGLNTCVMTDTRQHVLCRAPAATACGQFLVPAVCAGGCQQG